MVLSFLTGFVAGVLGYGFVSSLASLRTYHKSKLGGARWKIVAFAARTMGVGNLYNSKLRALRVYMLAVKLLRCVGVPVHAASTALALYYSEPVEAAEPVIAGLVGAVVLAAHVQRIEFATEVEKMLIKWEEEDK